MWKLKSHKYKNRSEKVQEKYNQLFDGYEKVKGKYRALKDNSAHESAMQHLRETSKLTPDSISKSTADESSQEGSVIKRIGSRLQSKMKKPRFSRVEREDSEEVLRNEVMELRAENEQLREEKEEMAEENEGLRKNELELMQEVEQLKLKLEALESVPSSPSMKDEDEESKVRGEFVTLS